MIFCSLYSGSSGNSIFVGNDNTKLLIDAGLPGKKIDEALKAIDQKPSDIDGIFVTHEHSDHIKGVGVLSRKYNIPIYANQDTWIAMESSIGKVKEENIKIIAKRSNIKIKDMDIKCFNIPHDAVSPMGYTLHSEGKRVSIATDFGTFTEEIKSNIKDSDVILLESNHDVEMLKFGPYPYNLKRRILSEIGHLSNEDCGSAILQILNSNKRKKIILGHLSNTNNYPDLAYQTVLSVLKSENVCIGRELVLQMAQRSMPSGYIKF